VVVCFFSHKEKIEKTLHTKDTQISLQIKRTDTKAFMISKFQALILDKMKQKQELKHQSMMWHLYLAMTPK
jgi:hypothetical protein